MIREARSLIAGGGARRAVGIDIGTSGVRAVVVKRRGVGVQIVGAFSSEIPREKAERPSPEAVTESLAGLVREHALKLDHGVVAFPLSSAIVRNTVVPLQGRNKIRQVIKFHAEPHIPFPIEEVVIDFHETAPPEGDRTPVIVIGAKKDLVAKLLDIVTAAGVDPEIIGVDALALVNNYLLRAGGAPPEQPVVLLDMGATKTLLVVMRGSSVRLARSITVGGDDITEALQKEFSLDFTAAERLKKDRGSAIAPEGAGAEERRIQAAIAPVLSRLSREADLSLRSIAATIKDTEVRGVYLSGGGALLRNMREFCAREFGCDAQYLSALSPPTGSGDEESMGLMGVATGLAVQGVGLGAAEVDFRREEYAYAGAVAKVKRQVVAAGILTLCIIGVTAFSFTRSFIERRSEYGELAGELERIYKEMFPAAKPVKAPAVAAAMLQKLKEYQQSYESFSALSSSAVSSLDILREISTLMPRGMKVQVTSLVIGQEAVEMDGLVNTPGDADKIKLALQSSKHFAAVDVPSTSAHGGNKHKFRLVAAMKK